MWWLLTGASIWATVLNARQDRRCFWIWLGTNALWIAYNVRIHAWEPAALFAVYWVLAVYGLRKWRRG